MRKLTLLLATLLVIVGASSMKAQEPYAVVSDDGFTLTFYYENNKPTGDNVYNLPFTPGNYPQGKYKNITTVTFDPSFADYHDLTTTNLMFGGCTKLKTINNIEYLNTENVTDMGGMFYGCSSLETLNLSHFDTKKVTDVGMVSMFYGCSSLVKLDLSSFEISDYLNDMKLMFTDCSSLETIYCAEGADWSTSSADKSNMFYGCKILSGKSGSKEFLWDSDYIDGTYAKVYDGTNGGYFTSISEKPVVYVPEGLKVTDIAVGEATVSWDANGQTTWVLQYGSSSSFTADTYTEMNVTTTPSVTLTGLDEDQGYYYVRVKAVGGTEESEWSDYESFQPSTDKFVVGSGTGTSSYLPTYTYYNYSLTQQIYTAEELGKAGLIESIGFCQVSSSAETRELDIYMVSTDKEVFANVRDVIRVTDADRVFSGKVTFAANKWTTIPLDTPFAYDGKQNVAIIVDDNTGDYSDGIDFLSFSTEEKYQAFYTYSDYTNCDPKVLSSYSFNTITSKDQIRIEKRDPEAYAVLTTNEEGEGKTLTFYYDGNKPTEGTVYDLPWESNTVAPWTSRADITSVTFDESFKDYNGLKNTSFMFYYLTKLETINNLENLNTEHVTDMRLMFFCCDALTSLDLGDNFDTSNVTDMSNMFYGCSSLKSLDLGDKFNTSNVTNMYLMFYMCKELKTLDLGDKFDTSNVTNMQNMFAITSLESLDLGDKFNTSNVTNMSMMFYSTKLTSLDVSSFDIAKVTNMRSMFNNCSNLETIYCAEGADWSGVEGRDYYGMFAGCLKLSGKFGSEEFPWNSEKIDGTYAKVYDGTNGGYFTYKGNRSYTLTVGEAKMATLYLDFDATIPDGVEVYVCEGLKDDEALPETYAVKITQGVIPANTGVFVKAAEGDYVFKAFIPDETAEETQVLQIYPDNILTGSTKKTTVGSLSVLTLGYANNADKTLGFWWYTGTEIPANRAYIPGDKLTSDGGVKGIRLVFDDETSISITPNPSPQGEGSWYSIDGRKMEGKPTQKGIYINNGRKVMVK